jgi:hypothetical protein
LASTVRRPDSAFDELVDALTATNQRTAATELKTAAAYWDSRGQQDTGAQNNHTEQMTYVKELDTAVGSENETGNDSGNASCPKICFIPGGNYLIFHRFCDTFVQLFSVLSESRHLRKFSCDHVRAAASSHVTMCTEGHITIISDTMLTDLAVLSIRHSRHSRHSPRAHEV